MNKIFTVVASSFFYSGIVFGMHNVDKSTLSEHGNHLPLIARRIFNVSHLRHNQIVDEQMIVLHAIKQQEKVLAPSMFVQTAAKRTIRSEKKRPSHFADDINPKKRARHVTKQLKKVEGTERPLRNVKNRPSQVSEVDKKEGDTPSSRIRSLARICGKEKYLKRWRLRVSLTELEVEYLCLDIAAKKMSVAMSEKK